MSIEQKKMIADAVKYFLYAALAVSGWLIKEAALEMREDVHDLKKDLGEFQKDIERRLIRVETKIENK